MGNRDNVADIRRDDYRLVSAKLLVVRERSFTVERRDGKRLTLPRSLLHGADDLNPPAAGGEWTFRLRAWKAEEVGLPGVELER